jgi:hypothetical protein
MSSQAYTNIKTSDRMSELEKNVALLQRNVFDLQQQLQNAYMRIETLTRHMAITHDSDSYPSRN